MLNRKCVRIRSRWQFRQVRPLLIEEDLGLSLRSNYTWDESPGLCVAKLIDVPDRREYEEDG